MKHRGLDILQEIIRNADTITQDKLKQWRNNYILELGHQYHITHEEQEYRRSNRGYIDCMKKQIYHEMGSKAAKLSSTINEIKADDKREFSYYDTYRFRMFTITPKPISELEKSDEK